MPAEHPNGACIFVCGGCGKVEPGRYIASEFHKPDLWFSRADEDGPQLACSKACVELVSKQTGKSNAHSGMDCLARMMGVHPEQRVAEVPDAR